MVEQSYKLDDIFGSLSDPTRRDIVSRVSRGSMSVGEVAAHYTISFAGVAKHLSVLERAGIITKKRDGKEQIVTIDPKALAMAGGYLKNYRNLWERRLDSLDTFLTSNNKRKGKKYGV